MNTCTLKTRAIRHTHRQTLSEELFEIGDFPSKENKLRMSANFCDVDEKKKKIEVKDQNIPRQSGSYPRTRCRYILEKVKR